jgi:hypothetical protein
MEVGDKLRPLNSQGRAVIPSIVYWVGLWASLNGRTNITPPGLDPRTAQPVAIRYIDYAIPAGSRIAYLLLLNRKPHF